MHILVTGGSGFIGSNFIRHMLSSYPGYRITNLDKLTYAGNPDNLRDIEKDSRYAFIHGDICDPKVVDQAIGGTDAIVNFAAETHVDRSILDAGTFIETDIRGTFTLLEAVRRHKTRRYIQISTDEVYGSTENGSFTEMSPLTPNSPYSSSKAGGDLLVRSYFVTYQLPVIITRASNNYGPYQYPEKIIPLFVTNLIEGKKVPLYGEGKNVRDWLFVTDHCTAIDRVLHNGREGEVYNIGGGNEISNLELTRKVLSLCEKTDDFIHRAVDRPGHDLRYSVDCTKIRQELGWEPCADFEQALKDTVQWYQTNDWWWKKLKNTEYMEYYRKQYLSAL